MTIKCNHFKTKEPSCRFYALPDDEPRVKVHVEGRVDFKKVAAEFSSKGVTLSQIALKDAYKEAVL